MDQPLQVEHEKLWKEKQMLVNEKKSLLLARLTKKDYERVYRPKLFNNG